MKNRVFGLDLMRAIAILLIVYSHGGELLPIEWKKYYFSFFPSIDGVSIFFVLSGFLIGTILLKNNLDWNDLKIFWKRRWLRTLPNYYLILGVMLIGGLIFPNKIIAEYSWKYFLFFQDFLTNHLTFFRESWSLCVEEWFYLTFPLALMLIYSVFKNKKKSFLITILLFILIPNIIRIILYAKNFGLSDIYLYYGKSTILRLDSVAFGIFAAFLYKYYFGFWKKIKKITLFSSIFIFVFYTIMFKNSEISNTFLALGNDFISTITSFLLLPTLSLFFIKKENIFSKTVTNISLWSYSMYLLNLTPIQGILMPMILKPLNWRYSIETSVIFFKYFLFWFLVLFCSKFLYKYFEKPIMNLRDK